MAAVRTRSQLQRNILRLQLHRGRMDLCAIIKNCSGGVEYGNKRTGGTRNRGHVRGVVDDPEAHRKYQSAYAAVSRSLRRLEDEGLVSREYWRQAEEDEIYDPDDMSCEVHPAHEAGTYRDGTPFPAEPARVYGRYMSLTDAGKRKAEEDPEFTFVRPKIGSEQWLNPDAGRPALTTVKRQLKPRAGRVGLTAARQRLNLVHDEPDLTPARRRLKVPQRGAGLTPVRRRLKKTEAP